MVSQSSERRGGSNPEGAGAAQPFGRRGRLSPTLIRRENGEELRRLGDHLLTPFGSAQRLHAFDKRRWFETYRTATALVKQKWLPCASIAVVVRWRSKM
jgi:hypothetical protein